MRVSANLKASARRVCESLGRQLCRARRKADLSVEGLVATQDAVIESNRFRLQKPTTDPAFIRFRIQEGIDDQIRYVEGRAPTTTVETRDDVGPEALDGVP